MLLKWIRTVAMLAALLFIMVSLPSGPAHGEETNAPAVDKAVHWDSEKDKIEAFLVEKSPDFFRLAVITADNSKIKVVLHSEINSMTPVIKELDPIPSTDKSIWCFEFRHRFSKTTIWMALEFMKDGKQIEDMTRTFYGDIFTAVVNDMF